MQAKDLNLLFEQLIAANAKAFAGSEYRVAFYALAGALDAARSSGHKGLVARVRQVALEQRATIDATIPFHDMASGVAGAGQPSAYESLITQAQSIESQLSSELAIKPTA
jgi:hypothetical protein